ncbi:MAG: tyrosine-type recombinase/integrase, partial [Anaerolineae bacterium]|nr:tyrosine-type recombinase/integrase [Anaerolineae bacterium]
SGVHQMLKRLKAKAGVSGRVNPHSFRHNFAREYLRNGGEVVTLARLLGHEDVNTTAAFYAVFSKDELQSQHMKFSPISKWFEEER